MNKVNNQLPIADLFVKYLENRCTAGEIKQLLEYFESDQNEDTLRSLIQAELGFADQNVKNNTKVDVAVLRVRSILIKEIKDSLGQKPVRLLMIPKWIRISAVWLLFTVTTALLLNHYWAVITGSSRSVKLMSVVTNTGERKFLTLSDGTKIWLSPSSSLEYPDQLIGNLREVKLEGEAFFEVAKDKKHPFVIHSGRMDTRVVGTSFNIQSYKTQINSTVTVVTGVVKVSVLNSSHIIQKDVTLRPNQRSQFDNKNGNLSSMDYPNAKWMLKRKEGILNYDGTSVQEVVADLARYYKHPVIIESNSKNCLCYGEFNTNRPINIVLEQLAAAINATVIIQKDKYILKGGCEE